MKQWIPNCMRKCATYKTALFCMFRLYNPMFSLVSRRLFEMGFSEQLHEILHRMPESRQTLLFSATLPKLLVEFARAGLHDPTLVRLDVDSKLSENLKVLIGPLFHYIRL